MNHGTRLAAVDLGSNSFRLEIGRVDHGQYVRTEYLKESVRQGNGMDEDRNLTPEAIARGVDCLARFGERLSGFKPAQVRAVATQTLREARNRDQFLALAKKALGFPIEVISGREEARLIYQGVCQMLPQTAEKRLVIDIGGRSTELILGVGSTPKVMESYRVGCVAWSTRYFPDGQFTRKAFESAEVAAKAVLDECLSSYRRDQWDAAYGSAGTVGAVGDVLAATTRPAGRVNREGLDWMLEQLLSAGNSERLRLPGLKEDRVSIIGGGLAILRAVFDLLQIDELQLASGGLRHGLIGELMGDASQRMYLPEVSVKRLAQRFDVDAAHAERVAKVAGMLFDQLVDTQVGLPAELLKSAQNSGAEETLLRHRRKLAWAANLHEIGAQISHSDYHKHGAYILDNADVLGLSVDELHRLSLLVLGHRGKLRKLELEQDDTVFIFQLLALRLAVILCHARRDPDVKGMALALDPRQPQHIQLSCRAGWSSAYPQSAHLLNEEVAAWQKVRWSLAVRMG
jgi:exopolyphosphatase / guanosine-5'-triphosphate,3'-diphosphate pyrophosphatase